MSLASLAAVEHLLACPRCHNLLINGRAGLECPACDLVFPSIRGKPVLVDFDCSVLSANEIHDSHGTSMIARRAHFLRLRRFLNPQSPVTRRNVATLMTLLPPSSRVLIVGGGTIGRGLNAIYESDEIEVVAFDIYISTNLQVVADGHQIPFKDSSFDAVILQAVLEHVLDPAAVVADVWRVLRPTGIVYAETPFLQQVHEGAYDFQRFTESGHRWLFRRFECIKAGAVSGPAHQLLWSINYTVRSLFRSRKVGLVARTIALPIAFLDRFVDESHAIDTACGVYLLGRRSDNEMTPQDIVAHYRGAQ